MTAAVLAYADEHRARFLDELKAFLAIPSVSTKAEHTPDVLRCADFVADQLRALGFDVAIEPTKGHPIVFATHHHAGKDAPTALFYGHYDVQPPEPLELWTTPPFEPTIRNDRIYARGATDDKGQVFAHIKALEAWMRAGGGKLPVNLTLLIEGEEEIGSPNLDGWIAANLDRLRCDTVVISDTAMFAPGLPAIVYGLRGLTYLQIDVQAASHDLHSGSYGGAIANPIEVLTKMLASLKDEHGRVTVAGFYDDVLPLGDDERAEWRKLPHDDLHFLKETGAPALVGEVGYSTLERKWARPTLEMNGILGGFTGEGAKTVLPAKAMAKVSCRLVPNQHPDKIAEALERHLRGKCPETVTMKIARMHGGEPGLVDRHHPMMKAAASALEKAFGRAPVMIREGGSIPVVTTFTRSLGAPVLLLGFGLHDDRAHSPDEKLDLANFNGGVKMAIHLWQEIAAAGS